MKPALKWLTLLLSLLALAGCGRDSAADLPPAEIVQNAATRMNALSGFHFIIERDGAPAYVDPDNLFSFRRAEGDYTAPDKARALVRITGAGLVTEVRVISIAAIQWQTNVLTGEWETLPPDWGFNPAVLFDEASGLQTVLAQDMTAVVLHGTEPLQDGPNGRFYHLSGQVSGDNLYRMSGNLIGPQPVTVDLWIAPDTFELVRAVVVEPEADDSSIWQIDFSDFDTAVPITPPI